MSSYLSLQFKYTIFKIYRVAFFAIYLNITNSQRDQLLSWLAKLLNWAEHCTGIAEVMGLLPFVSCGIISSALCVGLLKRLLTRALKLKQLPR